MADRVSGRNKDPISRDTDPTPDDDIT